MPEIIYDPEFSCCEISLEDHLSNTLGRPISLPNGLSEALEEDWAINSEKEILRYLKGLTGKEYARAHRNNSCNVDNDLDHFIVYTVYTPVGTTDWYWVLNTFVSIEVGSLGDPRYVPYSEAEIYRVDCLGGSGFFSWKLSWLAEPLPKCGREVPDEMNEKFRYGCSEYPTSEVREACYDEPIWVEKREGYVGRPMGLSFPCLFTPYVNY
jgi:hypothetical protein